MVTNKTELLVSYAIFYATSWKDVVKALDTLCEYCNSETYR